MGLREDVAKIRKTIETLPAWFHAVRELAFLLRQISLHAKTSARWVADDFKDISPETRALLGWDDDDD